MEYIHRKKKMLLFKCYFILLIIPNTILNSNEDIGFI